MAVQTTVALDAKRLARLARLGGLMGALILAGCAGPSPYVPPVEDRSSARGGSTAAQPSGPRTVPQSPGVSVQPVEDVPVFRPLRSEPLPAGDSPQPSGSSWPESRAPAGSSDSPPFQGSSSAPAAASTQSQNAAVVALLESAQQDTSSGDLRAAQGRLERALRIAPRDPQVYYQLADVQRRLGQFMQAEQVALKGVNVAVGQSAQLRRLWSLVALIRSEAGDSAGARQAQQEASRY